MTLPPAQGMPGIVVFQSGGSGFPCGTVDWEEPRRVLRRDGSLEDPGAGRKGREHGFQGSKLTWLIYLPVGKLVFPGPIWVGWLIWVMQVWQATWRRNCSEVISLLATWN